MEISTGYIYLMNIHVYIYIKILLLKYPEKRKNPGESTEALLSQCSSSKAFLRRSSSARSALGALIHRGVLELGDVTISGIQWRSQYS